ncbi:MAG: hypothetical protein CV087_04230 [Candidatus Brocadia sp. WS118]|nr:MAG: hypothetical protein CV087_04230 [Candidatus Brocadia sp. WS118]
MRELSIKEKDLLDRVLKKPELQPFFFRKLKGLHWFNPLHDSGFFVPEKNPKPVSAREDGFVNIPFWPVTEYLVTTSKELSVPENEEYAVKFIELIRTITLHAKTKNYSNYRTWWQLAKIIRNIPVHLIKVEDIELIDYWLDDPYDRGLVAEEVGEKWLPDLLGKQDDHCMQIALRLLDCLYKVNFVKRKTGDYERKEPLLRYDSYHAEEITKNVTKLSGLKLGLPAVKIFQNRLVSILNEGDKDSWSSIWRPAIEEHKQNGSLDDVDDLIVAAYRDCLSGFVDNNAQEATNYLRSTFGDQYQTLKRVAIHILNKQYTVLKNLVDTALFPEYFHNNFRHELWHLLNGHYDEFNPDQKKRVVEIIEGLEVVDKDKSVNARATAYKRAIWLSAIKDYSDVTIELYKKYTTMTEAEPKHPDFSSYMTSGWVEHKSPIPIEHLLTLNVDSLVETINNYKDTGQGWLDEPGLEGLVKSFKDVVKTKAKDIYRELTKFTNIDLAFIYPLIEAYRELWSEKRELPWNDVWPLLLDFCRDLVKRDKFWSAENAKERPSFVANRHWIVGAIGRLIEEGTRSDDHAFDKSLLPKAKEVLLVLLERQEGEEFKHDSDAGSVAINSPLGRCIEGLVNLTLRSCRLAHKEHGNHTQAWNQYESIYEAELKRSQRGEYEFATLVAMYLPNFLYMSREWVMSHLSDIFDQSSYQKWLCAMQGYSYVGTIYEEFYKYLKASGDFLKGLDDGCLGKRVNERIIQNIAVAYINSFEDIKQSDSLLSNLIEREKLDELSELVWFIWTLRRKDDVKLREKVYALWPRLLEIVDVNSREGRILASKLCRWASFVDQIDTTIETWLLKIAPYAGENHNASDLLQSLAGISDSQPLEAQKIWIKMLASYTYDYPEGAIRLIFKNLIALGANGERKAKEVVDAYIRLGIERPRTWLAEIKDAVEKNKELEKSL